MSDPSPPSPRELLDRYGLRPQHRHGQNFLTEPTHLQRIIDAADPAGRGPSRTLEVGPGTGILTHALLEAGARVVAVEVDGSLEPLLRDRFAGPLTQDRLTLIFADVLAGKHAINPRVLNALGQPPEAGDRAEAGESAFQLVANLPYHVASPLIVNLLVLPPAAGLRMTQGIVMVQKEVADRLTAPPTPRGGGKAYGPLGVMVQALCEVRRLAVLPPGCFWPPPGVSSALVRLTRRSPDPLARAGVDPVDFGRFVHELFARRRKQLGPTLRLLAGEDAPHRAASTLPGFDPTLRPEALSVDELISLAGCLRAGS